MQSLRSGLNSFLGVALILVSSGVCAQQTNTPATAPATTLPPTAVQSSLSSSLGVIVFPAKDQTPQQQASDEGSCFTWAKGQTGIDPMAPPPQQPATAETPPAASTAGDGARVKGAVRGAAAGAAIGAIAGDAGNGAAIGAAAGVVAGGVAKRRAQRQAAQQQQQTQANAAEEAKAATAQQKSTYNNAFSACMEGKGYTVR